VWAIYILLLAIDISVALYRAWRGYVLKRSILLASPFLLRFCRFHLTASGQPIVTFSGWRNVLTVSGMWTGADVEHRIKIGWLSVQAAVILASTTSFRIYWHALRAF
jgi:hypothetical protein